jgi:hypothetical protein
MLAIFESSSGCSQEKAACAIGATADRRKAEGGQAVNPPHAPQPPPHHRIIHPKLRDGERMTDEQRALEFADKLYASAMNVVGAGTGPIDNRWNPEDHRPYDLVPNPLHVQSSLSPGAR